MTPQQFVSRLNRREISAVCLFLGSEAYERRRCRDALTVAHLSSDSEGAVSRYDGSQAGLTEIVDDARAMSLFASQRLIVVSGAEAMLPRGARLVEDDSGDEETGGAATPDSMLAAYVKDPTPGVVLLFEATRFDLDGEDKKKADRVRKFFAAIPDVVEFKCLSPGDARRELDGLARTLDVRLDPAAAAMLVDVLAADMGRIATELEKLATFAGVGGTITTDDIVALSPDAKASTIFALVNALGRRDRARALASLDSLCRENEYLPLALSFLSSQFRQALAARDAGLKSAAQIQSYFSKAGVAMWGSRAEQVSQTALKFTREQLESGLKMMFEADRDLRDARPDDRLVMEDFVVRLTG